MIIVIGQYNDMWSVKVLYMQQREQTELQYSCGHKGRVLLNITGTLMCGKYVYCIMEAWIIVTRQLVVD